MRWWSENKIGGRAKIPQTPRALPDDDLGRRLGTLDLEPIKLKLCDPREGKGWPRARADDLEIKYLRFLYLTLSRQDTTFVPTREIDELWHAHILDTRRYAKDCETIFGEFVHHLPSLGMRGPEDALNLSRSFEETRRIYEETFGEPYAPAEDEEGGRQYDACGAFFS